jgi:hypothetical protein
LVQVWCSDLDYMFNKERKNERTPREGKAASRGGGSDDGGLKRGRGGGGSWGVGRSRRRRNGVGGKDGEV